MGGGDASSPGPMNEPVHAPQVTETPPLEKVGRSNPNAMRALASSRPKAAIRMKSGMSIDSPGERRSPAR
jgi:hypothetical protein